MRLGAAFTILLILLAACNQRSNKAVGLEAFLPKSAAIVIKVNHLGSLKSELKNNELIRAWKNSTSYQNILQNLEPLSMVESNSESLLIIPEAAVEDVSWIFVTKKDALSLFNESDTLRKSETIALEGLEFQKHLIDTTSFYVLEKNGYLMGSVSPSVLASYENSLRGTESDPRLRKLYDAAEQSKTGSVFFNTYESDALLSELLLDDSQIRLAKSSEWVSFDLSSFQDQLNFTGIALAKETVEGVIPLFKNVHPLPHNAPLITPSSANALISYTFSNYQDFAANQHTYLQRTVPLDTLFNSVEEISKIYSNDYEAVIMHTRGGEKIARFLENNSGDITSYQGYDIIAFEQPAFLNDYFNPIITEFSGNFFTTLGNAYVFAQELDMVKTIVRNYLSGATYEKSKAYETLAENLSDESNILVLSNANGLETLMKEDFSKQFLKDFKDAKLGQYAFGAQVISEDAYFHTNLIAKKIGAKAVSNTVTPLFSVKLDGEIATSPQWVLNHRNNQKEIVVQDSDHNLYLISGKGKVLWKKQLDGPIQGKIHQVDLYKNRRLQLAFTTNDQFLILDRNGKEVLPFNKSFAGGNLNPLAVFDYEGTKNYRFVVTQGSKVFMYNSKGEIVSGFKYTEAQSPVLKAPKHFRIGRRDYLVFLLENGELKILNRQGATRVAVNTKINFSENEPYLHKSKFSVTDKAGTLITVDSRGGISRARLNLNEDHGLDATSKTLVYMNDHELNIKGKKISLELGVYTKPQIFYIYDKIYVAVTDIQSEQIYLFDSSAKPIANFPVYGASLIDLADIERDRKLELVTKDQDSSLMVYKIN